MRRSPDSIWQVDISAVGEKWVGGVCVLEQVIMEGFPEEVI